MAGIRLHTLKNTPGSRRPPKRVGRGESSGSGKIAGRGHKGQMARSGYKRKPGFEGGQMRLILRIRKHGFTPLTRREYTPVNVGALQAFEDGAAVGMADMLEKGFVRNTKLPVKILGDGEFTRKLTVRAAAFSAAARKKIEAAGGACEIEK